MDIQCSKVKIRPWQNSDKESLLSHANNRKIWINLADTFPHPYSEQHAMFFLSMVQEQNPLTSWAICIEDRPIGSVGINLKTDIYRKTAEFGYWLGEEYWGQGIMSEVVEKSVPYIFANFNLVRLEAPVIEWNRASMRVMKKCGFQQEEIHKKAVIKDGVLGDLYYFVRLNTDAISAMQKESV